MFLIKRCGVVLKLWFMPIRWKCSWFERGTGFDAVVYAAPGQNEDIAFLLAYEHGAELMVAVGTHSNISF